MNVSKHYVLICVSVLLLHANLSLSQNTAYLPSLDIIIKGVTKYETRINNADMQYSCSIYNSGNNSPLIENTGRSAISNKKFLLDIKEKANIGNSQKLRLYALTYDGTTARSMYAHIKQGKISRDINRELMRTNYLTPRDIWSVVPESGGLHFSQLLSSKQSVNPISLQKYSLSTNIIGREEINGEDDIKVEVMITSKTSPNTAEYYRLYVSPNKNYAIHRVDHGFVKNGKDITNSN